jgi:phosphoenolpyruvate-protein phosphotransferase/dihydroxyacetone kinase phosphotransfer subunit
MVGIVLVSHSAKLAEAVKELAEQIGQSKVPIALAGGVDAPDNPFGTDATKVMKAIESVYSEDGVLVLMDLGSAILSAEMALDELLPPEYKERVILTDAPFVEGAVAATVQASVGSSLKEVAAEARQGQLPKSDQLGLESLAQPVAAPTAPAGAEVRMEIRNPAGLHARPAAQFVQTAARFQSDITVRNASTSSAAVNAKSPTSIMRIAVKQGHEIAVSAAGPDASQAIAALKELVDSNFGEGEAPPVAVEAVKAPLAAPEEAKAPARLEAGAVVRGVAASEGIAVGPAFIYRPQVVVERRVVDDAGAEWERFQAAVEKAKEQLVTVQAGAAARVGAQNARIFEAHREFLNDPEILGGVEARIKNERLNAEFALKETIEGVANELEKLGDELLGQRAVDLRDVGNRVIRILGSEEQEAGIRLSAPAIVIAHDLTPSDTAQISPGLVLGLCTSLGGATSHTAILARAQGLPAVVGLGEAIMSIADGTRLIVDGGGGRVWIEPEPSLVKEYRERQVALIAEREKARALAAQPAITRDGRQVEVAANVGNVAGARLAAENGAEGVGLLRTEFLYLDRATPPSEDEQVAAYAAIADALPGRPVIIRTLDIGGDKPAPYLDMPQELNPFLGWRAIRFCLDQPALFKTQLRAILRAAHGRNIKMMFPMVTTVEEVRRARALLDESREELAAASVAHAEDLEVGIMVETPSAAVIADHLASEVAFFSIGTNDLTQYSMAADRTNAQVDALADPLHPAVLRLIKMVIEAAHAADKWAGMCGEMAGHPAAIPILIGLGLDEFSMAPAAIPRAKELIRSLSYAEMQDLAKKALTLDTATAVHELTRALITQ